MPEGVNRAREAGLLREFRVPTREVARIDRRPGFRSEHMLGSDPIHAGRESIDPLLLALGRESLDDGIRERDGSLAVVRLGWMDDEPVNGNTDERPSDGELVPRRLDVCPLEPERLAAPEARPEEQEQERPEAMAVGPPRVERQPARPSRTRPRSSWVQAGIPSRPDCSQEVRS